MPEDNGTCLSPLEVTVLMCGWLRVAVTEAQKGGSGGARAGLCLPRLGLPHCTAWAACSACFQAAQGSVCMCCAIIVVCHNYRCIVSAFKISLFL